ncbi:MAG: winged helix-turn-helix transcriptional regulator [Clostridiales bacterium]|nr:winged helix-turn-helix transcriptional regulator [Clostridiales bacterium]
MKTGISKIRNRGIAEPFSYMNLIEAWGSGTPKILKHATESGLREPELIDRGSDFRMNLFRNEQLFDQFGVVDPTQGNSCPTKDDRNNIQNMKNNLSTADREVLNVIHRNPFVTQKEIAMELGWKRERVKYYIDKFKGKNILKRIGSSQKGYWKILIEEEDWKN